MIAADTSTRIAYLEGAPGHDTQLLDQALADHRLLMIHQCSPSCSAIRCFHQLSCNSLWKFQMIDVEPGYWQRAGLLRAKVLSERGKARLGDALIAQTCIDRKIPLLTRDEDFRAFADAARLSLIL